MSETILITGGAGFLGSHLAERALKSGKQVICVDNFSTGQKKNLASFSGDKNFHFVETDVCKPWETWTSKVPAGFIRSVKRVLHFASPASPPHYQRLAIETLWVNSLGLEEALKFADSVGAHVTFASTSEIYGDPKTTPQPESYWGNVNSFGPRSCYDESKRFGEALIYTWNSTKKTKHGMVRIFNTYGPRMDPADGRVVINFLMQARKREPLTVYGDGKQTRSFCYVDDLCAGIEKYSALGLSEPVNIGNDGEFTVLQLAKIVKDKIYSDPSLEIVFKPLPQDDPMKRRPDLTKAKKLLSPWEPKVPLEEGLKRMREWIETAEL